VRVFPSRNHERNMGSIGDVRAKKFINSQVAKLANS